MKKKKILKKIAEGAISNPDIVLSKMIHKHLIEDLDGAIPSMSKFIKNQFTGIFK